MVELFLGRLLFTESTEVAQVRVFLLLFCFVF